MKALAFLGGFAAVFVVLGALPPVEQQRTTPRTVIALDSAMLAHVSKVCLRANADTLPTPCAISDSARAVNRFEIEMPSPAPGQYRVVALDRAGRVLRVWPLPIAAPKVTTKKRSAE